MSEDGQSHARAAAPSEHRLWAGSPSQIQNLGIFLRSAGWLLVLGLGWAALLGFVGSERLGAWSRWGWLGLAALALIPLARAGWGWLEVRCFAYDVTSERLRIRRGVLSRVTEELELYRVKDLTLHEPLLYRIFGLASIHLHTSDRSNPIVVIDAIPDGTELREALRHSVEEQRRRRGVRELDV